MHPLISLTSDPARDSLFWGPFSTLVLAARGKHRIARGVAVPHCCGWSLGRRRARARARVRKLIFLGLDGLDPELTEKLMAEGKLPNLARLRGARILPAARTTFPALSPVAWSTFATGVNPAKHNIFDFLNRDLRTYAPELSSAKVRASAAGSAHREIRAFRSPGHRSRCAARASRSGRFSAAADPEHDSARAGDVSAGRFQRPPAFGDVLRPTCGVRKGRFPCSPAVARRAHPAEGPESASLERCPVPRRSAKTRPDPGDPARESYPLRPRRIHAVDPAEVSRAGRIVRSLGLCAFCCTGTGTDFALYVTPVQIDPGESRIADQPAPLLCGLSGETAGHVRDARDGRGHLGV